MMVLNGIKLTRNKALGLVFLCSALIANSVMGQILNTQIKARIKVEKKSEFISIHGIAENLTLTDQSLRYEFMAFKKDSQGNTAKQNQGNRFFLKGGEVQILSDVTINYNIEGHIIIALLIFDEDDKPVAQDRLELPEGGRTHIRNEKLGTSTVSQDQALPQDGFFMKGYIIENSITKAGRDFHRYFYSEYYNKQILTSKNIVIDEIPWRSRTTKITISIDDQVIWQFFAQPKKEFLKKMATAGLNRSIQYLQQLQRQQDEITKY
jgi:hypothetical protein